MRFTDQYLWNIIFSLFFIALTVMAVIILEGESIKPLTDVTFLDLTLITLASWRLIRLFVYDNISKFFREQFWNTREMKTKVVLEKPTHGPRRTLADLLSCPWCFGMWAAALVTFFYFLTPYAFYFVLFLAVAAVATFLQIFTNMIGWIAEKHKQDAGG